MLTSAITPTHVLNWLVQTGVVFYRQGLFENKIILNQEWIISAIYTLFNRENPYSYRFIQENKGVVSGKQLNQIWNENSEGEKELFVSFMKSCELCYETTPQPKEEDRHKRVDFDERTFVVPQLLPNKQEDYFWEGRECLYVRYRQSFMHKGTIESFIFRSQEKYSTQIIQLWNAGIRLKNGNDFAEVERINDQELQIRITPNAKDLLDKIRNLIDEIINKEITELVSEDGKNFVRLSNLEKTDISQNKTILSENGISIEIEKLLIFLKQDKQNTFKMKKHQLTQSQCNNLVKEQEELIDRVSFMRIDDAKASDSSIRFNLKKNIEKDENRISEIKAILGNHEIVEYTNYPNQTTMQDQNNNQKNESSSDKGVTIIFNPNINNSSTNNNTNDNKNDNKNSQSQQIDFKQFVNTLENLQRNFKNLKRDVEEKLEEDSDNKELQAVKVNLQKTIEAAEVIEIEAKKADEGSEEAKSNIKKDKSDFFYYAAKVATYFPKLAQVFTNPKNWQNAKESLEAAQSMGGQLGL